MRMDRADWLQAIGLQEDEVPEIAILEGSWWTREGNRTRLAMLDDVRELSFPEVHWGRQRGRAVVYSCATYGASRAVEPVHYLSEMGTDVFVQIGTCGAIAPGITTGDIVLPARAIIGEGASQYYGGRESSRADRGLLERSEGAFRNRGFRVHSGLHITTSALFAQSKELIASWKEAGYLAVDMETSAVFTVATAKGARAVSLLFAWDELVNERTFLDVYTADERKAQARANRAIFEVALELLEDA